MKIHFYKDPDSVQGNTWLHCYTLPGVFANGDDLESAKEDMKEAITTHCEFAKEDEEKVEFLGDLTLAELAAKFECEESDILEMEISEDLIKLIEEVK